MADVKGPRSLVLWDLTEIAREARPSDLRPHPVALTAYLLSNSGQGPSLDIIDVPSGAVSFVLRAAQGAARPAWTRIRSEFQPLRDSSDQPAARRSKKTSAAVPGRAGWSKNHAFEDLCKIFDAGFADRVLAGRWLGRYVLGRPAREPEKSRLRRSDASWALAELLLQEVLGMKSERVEAIKAFSDKLAEHIVRSNERKLYYSIVFDKPYELRAALIRAQRRSVDGTLLFGLDEYANAWLHEDGDEFLVRDLVAIRVVERLALSGYFEKNPEDLLPEQENEENAETAERE